MSVIHVEGFGHRSASDIALEYTVSGTVVPAFMHTRRLGCYALGLAGASIKKTLSFQGGRVITGFAYLRTADGGSNDAGDLLQIIDGAGSIVHVSIAIDTDGYIKGYRGDFATGTLLATSSNPVPDATPVYISIDVTVSDSSGVINVFFTDSAFTTTIGSMNVTALDTQNGGTTSIGALRLSGPVAGGTFADWYVIDPLVLFGYGFSDPGPSAVLINPRVDSQLAGGNYGGELLPGGTVGHLEIDEDTQDGDTTYSASPYPGAKSVYGFFGLTHVPEAIHATRMVWTLRKDGSGARGYQNCFSMYAWATSGGGSGSTVVALVDDATAVTTSWACYTRMYALGQSKANTCIKWGEPNALGAQPGVAWSMWYPGIAVTGDADGTTNLRITHGIAQVLSTKSTVLTSSATVVSGGTTTGGTVSTPPITYDPDPDAPPPPTYGGGGETSGNPVRVTQMTVQTISDADVYGEVRVTQMVVQTISDEGEVEVTREAPSTFVAEVTMATDTSGTLETFLITDGEDFATLSSDTPASTIVHSRLMQPANLARSMFAQGATFGAVAAGYGVCEIANSDGRHDEWADYSVAGQSFVLRSGTPGTPYPSAWTTVLRATMQSIECDIDTIRIRLRDRIELMERALMRDTNYPDPAVVGNVLSVTPKLIDAANLVYAVGRPPEGKLVVIQSLRDNGLPIAHVSGGIGSYSSTIADEGDVASTGVSAGRFNWNPDSGRLKVGTKPAGTLTATIFVIDDSASWDGLDDAGTNGKIGTIISQLAQSAGISSADIVSADVNAVNIACGDVNFGFWDDGEARVLDAAQAVANSLGVWFGFDRLDRLRMGQLGAPEGDPDWTLTQHNIVHKSLRRVTSPDPGRGVPVWRVVARSAHNDAPTTTFAGAVSETNKAALKPEWPVETAAEDAAILDWCPAATELVIDVYSGGTGPGVTASAVPAGDAGEAARRLALYGGVTEMVQVDVWASAYALTKLDLGSVVRLQFDRYGWDDGVDFVITGIRTS